MTAGVRDALARAHYEHEGGGVDWEDLPDLYRESWALAVDQYVPTVSRLVDQGAANALRAAADAMDGGRRYGNNDLRADMADQTRARAAALTPPATEPEGQQA